MQSVVASKDEIATLERLYRLHRERLGEMKVLVAFDVDGTLETSQGPVKIDTLVHLDNAGVSVVIVSPSNAYPREFEGRRILPNGGGSRSGNLLEAKRLFPSDLYFYVSDNGDIGEAQIAGFVYVDRMAFWQGAS